MLSGDYLHIFNGIWSHQFVKYSDNFIVQLDKQDGCIELFTDEGDTYHSFNSITEIECYNDTSDFISTQEWDPQFDDTPIPETSYYNNNMLFEFVDDIYSEFIPYDFVVGEYPSINRN